MNAKSLFSCFAVGWCCLLLLGGCASDALPAGDSVAVGFSASGVSGEITTRADIRLWEGVTMRVLAYRHTDGTLRADAYMGENTYTIQADGTLKANEAEMLLPSDSYDFYTVMPALSVNHSGNAPTVSVDHLTDYAVSQTSAVAVAPVPGGGTQKITLAALERKCPQLAFQLSVSGAVVNNEPLEQVAITEAIVTDMADGPLTAMGVSDLSAATSCTTPVTMDATRFITDAGTQTLSAGGGCVLPKPAGSCGLKLSASYNGQATNLLNFEAATITNIEFKKGYRYAFVALWQENAFRLFLQVAPWTSAGINTDMGSSESRIYPLGEWTVKKIESSLGDGGVSVSISGWQQSSWSGNLGEGGLTVGSVPGWTSIKDLDTLLGEGGLTVGSDPGWISNKELDPSLGEGGMTVGSAPGWVSNKELDPSLGESGFSASGDPSWKPVDIYSNLGEQ